MPLTYEKFMKHQQEENGKSWQDADKLWEEYKADPDRQRDELGPPNSKLRIYTAVEEYLVREDVTGASKQQISGTKQYKSISTNQQQELNNMLEAAMPGWEELQVGKQSGATSSAFLQPWEKSSEPMHAISNEASIPKIGRATQKELSRKRAKAYDEVLKQLTNGNNTWKKIQDKAADDVAKFKSENQPDEYEHFLDLVDARLKVSSAILEDKTESDLQTLLSSLSEKEASLLPATVQHIHSLKFIKDESQKILIAEDEDILTNLKDKGVSSIKVIVPWPDLAVLQDAESCLFAVLYLGPRASFYRESSAQMLILQGPSLHGSAK